MSAYAKTYLSDAQENLGVMLDYAVNCEGYDLRFFYQLFLASDLSRLFAMGAPYAVCGHSGVELARLVMEEHHMEPKAEATLPALWRSQEFWTGWALAYYQFDTAMSFRAIETAVGIERIWAMYYPYHEMDLSRFCADLDAMIVEARPKTNLHYIRIEAELSQSELALASGVSVRTIQHYEQRQKDINKAGIDHIMRLSAALGCQPTDLVEPFNRDRYEYAVLSLK